VPRALTRRAQRCFASASKYRWAVALYMLVVCPWCPNRPPSTAQNNADAAVKRSGFPSRGLIMPGSRVRVPPFPPVLSTQPTCASFLRARTTLTGLQLTHQNRRGDVPNGRRSRRRGSQRRSDAEPVPYSTREFGYGQGPTVSPCSRCSSNSRGKSTCSVSPLCLRCARGSSSSWWQIETLSIFSTQPA
jgi:hypothetical protein